jgi:hypothetical protein
MPESSQSFESHTRWYPLYHFIASPILLASVVVAINQMVRNPSGGTLWGVLLSIGIFTGVAAARVQALTVQNRLIRLEETLRMQRVLPAEQQGEIAKLSVKQFVALRFASDEELPILVRRVLAGELASQKAIKRAIKSWRPDVLRA